MNPVRTYPIDPESAVSSVARDILLTLVTCGVYNLFWLARQFRVLNAFLGREQFRFGPWLLLTLLTCGVYHVYTEYRMGRAIVAVQRDLGQFPNEQLPLICLLLSIFGFTVVADAIQQGEINGFFEPE